MKFKKILRRYAPKQQSLQQNKAMRWVQSWLLNPNLWHLNRRSVAAGFAAGLFAGFLPLPFHMLLAVLFCFFLRGHVAISILATWISNPLTYAPIYYFNYKIGAFLLGQRPLAHLPLDSYESLLKHLEQIWQPLLLGSLLCGLIVAAASYIAIRMYWRSQVLQGWSKRKAQRLLKAASPTRRGP